MLDRMRRHKGWLKWSLALVVLAFVFLYFPGFMDQTGGVGLPGGAALPGDVVARVGDKEISLIEFQQIYSRQLQAYRLESGGEISEDMLRSLGIDRRILQQMIDANAALSEAERLGLEVSDAEVRERILTFPAFQVDGRFIGEASYRQLLQQQRPPLSPARFEEEIRNEILVERLQAAVTGWVRVSDAEIAEEHRRRNERVRVDVVAFRAADFREDVEAADGDVELLFAEEAANYEVPEKRRLRFLLVDQTAIFDSLALTDDEARQYYDGNLSQYQTPGQIGARHILLRVEEDDEEAAAERAAELAAEARGGADFAALAREHSQDEVSAAGGGDLGLFGRGRMVPEFENAAFELAEGEISDPVRSPFGYHVIQVTEKQEEVTQPFDEVRAAIENTLKRERSSARATALARAIAVEASTPEELESAAAARGYELQESGFAAQGEPILGLGLAQEVSAQAFAIDPGAVAGPIVTPSGPAFVTVTDVQEPYVPELDEVRDQVREDVIRKKSLTLARERAAEAAETLRAADDFAAAAEEAEWAVGSSDLVARGSALPEVGPSAAVEAVAFGMTPGSVSDAIEAGDAAVVVRLVEREEASAADLAENRDTLRDELTSQRRSRFFTAYMDNVKGRLSINIDLAVLAQATGQV